MPIMDLIHNLYSRKIVGKVFAQEPICTFERKKFMSYWLDTGNEGFERVVFPFVYAKNLRIGDYVEIRVPRWGGTELILPVSEKTTWKYYRAMSSKVLNVDTSC